MFPFLRREPPKSKPIPQRWPARKECDGTCNNQEQSPFFSKLPPEIRNLIYEYLFATPSPEWEAFPHLSPHPLSPLLTCHRVNHEANLIAFQHHPVPIDLRTDNGIYICFQNRTAHLSSNQLNAISRICAVKSASHSNGIASMFSNCMMFLPNLKTFEIRMLRHLGLIHNMRLFPPPNQWLTHEKWDDRVEKYVPDWFKEGVVAPIARSHGCTWEGKRDWELQWPQLEHPEYYHTVENMEKYAKMRFEPFMSPDAVGKVRGVDICHCECRQIFWTEADLVNTKTGRKVTIEAVLKGKPDVVMSLDQETLWRKIAGFNAIILRPGSKPLPVREDPYRLPGSPQDTTGFAFDGDEEYWEGIRRRNWDVGAIARYCWKGLTTLNQKSTDDPLPGSKFHGQGDWERLRDMGTK